MWFSTFILKNLTRRPLRSALTAFAIAIAIGSVVSLVGIADGFERSFLDLYEDADVDMLVVRSGGSRRFDASLEASLGDKIKEVPGVREVLTGLTDIIALEEAGLYRVLLQGWEPGTAVFDHLHMLEGRPLQHGDTKQVILGAILAENLEKSVGDSLEIMEGETYTIVGVYEANNIYEDGAMVIPLAELQRIMDRPGQITGFSLILDDPDNEAEVQAIRKRIESLDKRISARPTAEHIKSLTEIKLAKGMAWLTSCIALFIGFFGMMNTMVMSVHERTREIGILRAVGWRVGRVIRMVLMEAVFLSILGAFGGIIGSVIILRLLTEVPAVNGLIDGRVEPILVLYGFVIAIVLGLIGSIIPAFHAARMLPTEALRHE